MGGVVSVEIGRGLLWPRPFQCVRPQRGATAQVGSDFGVNLGGFGVWGGDGGAVGGEGRRKASILAKKKRGFREKLGGFMAIMVFFGNKGSFGVKVGVFGKGGGRGWGQNVGFGVHWGSKMGGLGKKRGFAV